jgi:hypothetical protein
MKINYSLFNAGRILFIVLCLILTSHCGISQSVTLTETKVNSIVRDLQICDAVTIERDILKAYSSSLTSQLDIKIAETTELTKDRDKYKKKTKRRGKIITTSFIIIAIETVIIFL